MSSERIKILAMLEEGKITSSEAIELLDNLDSSEQSRSDDKNISAGDGLSNIVKDVIDDFNKNSGIVSEGLLEKFHGINEDLKSVLDINLEQLAASLKFLQKDLENIIGKLTDDLGKNTEGLYLRLQEEASTMNNLVNEKDEQGTDKLNRSMGEIEKNLTSIPFEATSLAGDLSGMFRSIMQNKRGSMLLSETHRRNIEDASCISLHFEGYDGSICIDGYDGDDIETVVYCRTSLKTLESAVIVADEPIVYSVKPVGQEISSLSLDIKIPKKKFKDIHISTSNAKIEANDLYCGNLICAASKGRITLSGLVCDSIECSVSDGKVEVLQVKSRELFIKAHNSPVKITGSSFKDSRINSTKGSVSLTLDENIYGHNEYSLSSVDDRMDIRLSIPSDSGIYIDAFCLNGFIDMEEIKGFSYQTREVSNCANPHIVGQTGNFEAASNSVRITAQAANSGIRIRQ